MLIVLIVIVAVSVDCFHRPLLLSVLFVSIDHWCRQYCADCDSPVLPSVLIVLIAYWCCQCWLFWLSIVVVSADFCVCPLLPLMLIVLVVHCCCQCWLLWLTIVTVSVDCCDCSLLLSVLIVVIVHCCRQCCLLWLSIVTVSVACCDCLLLPSVLIVVIVRCCRQCWLLWLSIVVVSVHCCDCGSPPQYFWRKTETGGLTTLNQSQNFRKMQRFCPSYISKNWKFLIFFKFFKCAYTIFYNSRNINHQNGSESCPKSTKNSQTKGFPQSDTTTFRGYFYITAYVSEKQKCRRKKYRKTSVTVRLVSA